MYRTQFSNALRSFLRFAETSAVDAILNRYGELLSQSPEPRKREQILEKIKNTPQLYNWAEGIATNSIKNQYPNLSLDDVDDIASKAVIQFWNVGLGEALDSWDFRAGSSLRPWITTKLRWAAKTARHQVLRAKQGQGNDYSLDARVNSNPKYQSGASGDDVPPNTPPPPFVDYNKGADTIDYKNLLEMADEQEAAARKKLQANPADAKARMQIKHIQEARNEIKERQRQEQQEETPYRPQDAGPSSRPVRKDPLGQGTTQFPVNPKRQQLDSGDARIQEQSTSAAYKGLPAFILDNSKISAALQKKLGTTGGRLYLNRLYHQHTSMLDPKRHPNITELDPQTHRVVSEQMLGAMVDSKTQLDQTYKKSIVNQSTGEVTVRKVTDLKPIFKQNVLRRLQAAKVSPEVIDQVLYLVSQMNARQFLLRVGDADESMRFYQYEKAKQQLNKKELTPDDIEQVADIAHTNIGYRDGARMFARREKKGPNGMITDYDLSPLQPSFGADNQQSFMRNEARRYFNHGLSQMAVPQTLPADSTHFIQKMSPIPLSQSMLDAAPPAALPQELGMSQENQNTAPQRELAASIRRLVRLAATLDDLGIVSAGDDADRAIRISCILSGL